MRLPRAKLGGQLSLLQEIEDRNTEPAHQPVRELGLQTACSLHYVMHLGLGDPQQSGEPTLGVFAILNSHIYECNKSRLKLSKRDPLT